MGQLLQRQKGKQPTPTGKTPQKVTSTYAIKTSPLRKKSDLELALATGENLFQVLNGARGGFFYLHDGELSHPDKWSFDCLSGNAPILLHGRQEEWSISGSLKENKPTRFAIRGYLNTGERYRLIVEKENNRVWAHLYRCPPFDAYGRPRKYYVCYRRVS